MKFLTLLLGLVTGPHGIELAVEPPVTTVELLLDGTVCGRATAPAWSGRCDFGTALAPHELVAVGRDAEGKEVARDRQWINLPHPPAEAQFLFENQDGKPRARLHWNAVVESDPAVLVTLDEQAVKPDAKGWIALPEPEPDVVHVLEAELIFELGVTARAVATFGGRYGSSVATELTALPFEITGKATVESLRGKFRDGEEELTVTAVDQGGADLLIVRQGGYQAPLVRIAPNLRLPTGLGKEGFVTFVAPYLHHVAQGANGPVAVFPTSDWRPGWEAGVHWLRRKIGFNERDRASGLRLADAVAVAGSTASSRGRRRAVLLVIEEPGTDESLYRPEQVRAYLETLGVPLVVWNTTLTAGATPDGWGQALLVRSPSDVRHAIASLEATLARQTVVWFEGGHRPQAIVPAPGATGIKRLAPGFVPP